VEEEPGGVVKGRYQLQSETHAEDNCAADNATEDAQWERGVDPVKTVHMNQGVRGTETHSRYEEQNGCVEECLIETQTVVRGLEQIRFAEVVCDIGDPGLGHGPGIKLGVIVDERNAEESDRHEEEVKLVLTRALNNEAGLFAHFVDLPIEVQTQNEIDDAIQKANDILVDIDSTRIEAGNHYPYGHSCENTKEYICKGSMVIFRVLHAVHDNVVGPEEGKDVEMVAGSRKVKCAIVALYIVIDPEGTSVFVHKFQESYDVEAEASKYSRLERDQAIRCQV
jgi:hypothetical protein